MDEIKAFVTSPYTWLTIGLGAILGVWWWKMNPTTANFTLGISVVAFTVSVFLHPWTASQPIPIRILCILGAFSVSSLSVYFILWTTAVPADQSTNASIDQPKLMPAPPPLSPSQIVSLYRLFKEDVPGIKTVDFAPVRLTVQGSGETSGTEPRLHFDFVGLSKWVSFYVPSSRNVRDIVRFIADNYSILTGIEIIELILTKPGEFRRSTEELKFTGSVVLYHEDDLSSADLANLEEYYAARHLTPVWRSTGYAQTQILLRKSNAVLEQLLKVPEKMQPPQDKTLVVTGITAGVDGERIEIRNKGYKPTP